MEFDFTILEKWVLYNPKEPMLFQTMAFFVLFSLWYLVFNFFNSKVKPRNLLLLVFCLFFYYKISGFFVVVLCGMAFSDFFIGKKIFQSVKESTRKKWLGLSFLINVGALVYFKYTYFFINLINDVASSDISLSFKILQPIGISYFVFKSLSYVIDLNREVIEKPEKNFLTYLLFVSYFPNILAGPITKARDLIGQFNTVSKINKDSIKFAIYLISIGLIKKIVVADIISANMTDRVFESPQFFTPLDLFMSTYGGLLQLYFDFAGYTDMAVGISLLLGIEIGGNFNQPFKAVNISSFWKRWHITLYDWLSDYVFQPIAFSLRKYKIHGTIIAIFITFLLSGLWHGANLTFVVWGLLHGLAIVLEILTAQKRKTLSDKFGGAYKFLSIFLTFNFLAFSSVLINSANLSFTADYFEKMFSGLDFSLFSKWVGIYCLPFTIMVTALVLQYLPVKWYSKGFALFSKLPIIIVALLFCLLIIILYQIASEDALPFVYIDF